MRCRTRYEIDTPIAVIIFGYNMGDGRFRQERANLSNTKIRDFAHFVDHRTVSGVEGRDRIGHVRTRLVQGLSYPFRSFGKVAKRVIRYRCDPVVRPVAQRLFPIIRPECQHRF